MEAHSGLQRIHPKGCLETRATVFSKQIQVVPSIYLSLLSPLAAMSSQPDLNFISRVSPEELLIP